jgi:uncharacterized protein (TIGR02996 family)
MTDRRTELLAQIRTATDDHAHQVYADWLEQEGDATRAMLIRLQCELANLARWEPRFREASWEVDALLAAHGARWRGELPALAGVEWTDFERGFVSTVRLANVAALYEHADAIAQAAPIRCVEIAGDLDERTAPVPETAMRYHMERAGITVPVPPENLERVALPWLECLRLTGLYIPHFDPVRSLLSLPAEIEVRRLDNDAATEALIDAALRGRATPLVRLAIGGEHTIAAAVVNRLGSAAPGELRHLAIGTEFEDNDTGYFQDPTLRVAGAHRLASQRLDGLETLDVQGQRVTADGLEVLVDSLPRLRELDARASEIADLDFLATSHATSLVALDLSENAFGDAGARAIAHAPRLARLRSLELDLCEITSAGVAALVEAPFWPLLRHLDLGRNPLGVDGAIALDGAAHPVRLGSLGLADVELSRAGADVLAGVEWLAQLAALDLSRNWLGESHALLDALGAGGVRSLALATTALDADSLAALTPLWRRVVHLDLHGNVFHDIAALLDGESPIQTLDLCSCGLPESAAIALGRIRAPRLRTLQLDDNPLGNAGVSALLRSRLIAHVRKLDVASCELDDGIVDVLTDLPSFGALEVLDLANTRLSEHSLITLARAPSLRAIKIQLTANVWELTTRARDELEARFGRGWHYRR